MIQLDCKVLLRQYLAEGKYNGYLISATNKLLKRLPLGHTTFEDCMAWMQVYALEAIDAFDPYKGCRFTTFLYRHLFTRSLADFNYSWNENRQPQGSYVLPFSHFDKDSEYKLDLTSCEDESELTLEIKDLLSRLSERSRQILSWMFDVVKDSEFGQSLIDCFFHERKVRELREYTGCTVLEIHTLINEVRSTAPDCIRSLS